MGGLSSNDPQSDAFQKRYQLGTGSSYSAAKLSYAPTADICSQLSAVRRQAWTQSSMSPTGLPTMPRSACKSVATVPCRRTKGRPVWLRDRSIFRSWVRIINRSRQMIAVRRSAECCYMCPIGIGTGAESPALQPLPLQGSPMFIAAPP